MNDGVHDARTRRDLDDECPPACEKLLTLSEVARRLNVKVKTVYNWRSEGYRIPGEVRVGPQTIRFRPQDLEAWIAKGGFKRKPTSHEGRPRMTRGYEERAQDVPICTDAPAGRQASAGVDGPAPAAS